MSLRDILAQFKHVDDPDVLERIKISPGLLEALRIKRPENWWGTGLNPNVLFDIAREDGIPVVWVPPSPVLLDLAAAYDHQAKMVVLLSRKQEILDNCKTIIRSCDHPRIADASTLTEKAIAAYNGGHPEAAMALAVSVSEPLAVNISIPASQSFTSREAKAEWDKYLKNKGRYKRAEIELRDVKTAFSDDNDWLYKALIAPIPSFFTGWAPNSEHEPPTRLSRHVVAHQPTQQHFSQENTLLSLMLATSLLYASQRRSEENYQMDDA